MIPQEYIQEIVRRTDIVDLVQSYVQLKRTGRIDKGLCPFHNEKTPSFCVYPETQSYYCFGCGSGGDVITFAKNIQNLEYIDTIKFLASRAGMPLPDEDDDTSKIRSKVFAINRETALFYVGMLNSESGKNARAYLRTRALSDKSIRGFGLGYAPDDFGILLKHLSQKGYSQEELVLAGVCKKSERGTVYDAFRDRLMFPIMDLRSNVIAFGGRLLGEKGPKYLNSSDTPVFKKSHNLFALNIARKNTDKRFILAEGYMDVISLHQAGFTGAVATLGTALTSEQAKLLSNYAQAAVICYDSDEAGQKATARAINILKQTTLKVSVLNIQGAKDPDEFIKKYGASKFSDQLSGSRNTIEYALQNLKRDFDMAQDDGRAGYIRKALDVLAASASPSEQDIYAGRIAEETDVSKAALITQLQSVSKSLQRRRVKEREKRMLGEGLAAGISLPYGSKEQALGTIFAEQQLVAAILKTQGEYLPLVEAKLLPEYFSSSEMQTVYTLLLQKNKAGEKHIELSTLTGDLDGKTISAVSKILAQNHDIVFSKQDVQMFADKVATAHEDKKDPSQMSEQEMQQYIEKLAKKKS